MFNILIQFLQFTKLSTEMSELMFSISSTEDHGCNIAKLLEHSKIISTDEIALSVFICILLKYVQHYYVYK